MCDPVVHLGKETTGACVAAPYIPLDNRLQADVHRLERMHEAQTDIPVSDILFSDVSAFERRFVHSATDSTYTGVMS